MGIEPQRTHRHNYNNKSQWRIGNAFKCMRFVLAFMEWLLRSLLLALTHTHTQMQPKLQAHAHTHAHTHSLCRVSQYIREMCEYCCRSLRNITFIYERIDEIVHFCHDICPWKAILIAFCPYFSVEFLLVFRHKIYDLTIKITIISCYLTILLLETFRHN